MGLVRTRIITHHSIKNESVYMYRDLHGGGRSYIGYYKLVLKIGYIHTLLQGEIVQ